MLWLKAFHVVAVITWFAGLFYLPRLFVYHADARDSISIERFKIMERRLFALMTIGAVAGVALGAAMLVASQRPPMPTSTTATSTGRSAKYRKAAAVSSSNQVGRISSPRRSSSRCSPPRCTW